MKNHVVLYHVFERLEKKQMIYKFWELDNMQDFGQNFQALQF